MGEPENANPSTHIEEVEEEKPSTLVGYNQSAEFTMAGLDKRISLLEKKMKVVARSNPEVEAITGGRRRRSRRGKRPRKSRRSRRH